MTSPPEQQPQRWYGHAQRPGYHVAPPQGPPSAPPGPPAVFNIGKSQGRRFVIASAIIIPLGLVAIVGGVLETLNGRLGGIIAVVFGVACLGIGLVPVFNRRRAFRPRQLVIEQPGIRWDDPRGEPWAVRWQELAAVALCRHEPGNVGPEGVTEKVNGVIVDRLLGERVLVRLDLFPGDPGFHQRHPELAHLWIGDRLRLTLGHTVQMLSQMDAAIRHFQPGRYLGIQRTEAVIRLP